LSRLAAPRPPSGAARPTGTIILRNSLVVTVGSLLLKVATFLFNVQVVRLLGDAGFGQYATVVAFVGLFSVFFELGMSQYVERTVARDRARTRLLFWNLLLLRGLLAGLGCLAIVGAAIAVGYEPPLVLGVLLLTGTFLLAALLTPLTTVLTANEHFLIPTVAQVSGQILSMSIGLGLLLAGQSFLALLYTGFIVMPLQIGLCLWGLHRHRLGPLPFQLEPRSWPGFIRASLPFGLTSLALTYNFNADTVILGFFRPDAEVGWYGAAYRLVFSIVGLVGGFLVALTPSLARAHLADPERAGRLVQQSLRWMALFALPAAAGVSILAPGIVLLLYGEAYQPAGPVLAIVAWDVPLLLFTAFSGNVTAAIRAERPAALIFLACAALNIVLNLLFIPAHGMLAAAWVTLVTDGLAALCFYRLLDRRLQAGRAVGQVARTTLAAGLMGGLVWLARDLPLPLAVAAGVASFAALALALRLVDPAELAGAARWLGWRAGRRPA
jgi:O-antigen/teichoic acid export membrane protein